MPTLTVDIPGYGQTTVTTAAFDAAMSRYLPSSPAKLRELCESRSEPIKFDQVKDVCAFIAMLADFDYNVDDSPLSVY